MYRWFFTSCLEGSKIFELFHTTGARDRLHSQWALAKCSVGSPLPSPARVFSACHAATCNSLKVVGSASIWRWTSMHLKGQAVFQLHYLLSLCKLFWLYLNISQRHLKWRIKTLIAIRKGLNKIKWIKGSKHFQVIVVSKFSWTPSGRNYGRIHHVFQTHLCVFHCDQQCHR